MKLKVIFVLVLLTVNSWFGYSQDQINRDRPLNLGWRFQKGDYFYSAEYNDYDDSGWRIVDLPHDWSIEDLPGQDGINVIGPFSRESDGKISTGHTVGGTAWYRKTFTITNKDKGKIVILNFDGVYMESEVWINGERVGYHPNGYMPFYYDITPFLLPTGEENLISVRVQNIGDNSRWYSGSGIYRQVWLTVMNPVHVDVWGTFISTPTVSASAAEVDINITLNNKSDTNRQIDLQTRIIDSNDRIVGSVVNETMINARNQKDVHQHLVLEHPKLWSLERPTLYRAETSVLVKEKAVDVFVSRFGIRSIEFSPDKGFTLNGEPVLLKGACIHHDNGILGAAAFPRAEERRVEILKVNGYNAIRTAHNPPSKQFLDACDRQGILVINEAFDTWEAAKRPQGVHRFFRCRWRDELTAFMKRDRNHPSVIIWSIGNEIRERATARGLEIGGQLAEHVRSMDSTRPVTNAICDFWDSRGKKWSDTAPAFKLLDVHGYNYQWQRYEEDHTEFPERIIIGTESIPGHALQNWRLVEKHPYVIGDFVWTGMDYLGESGLAFALYVDPGARLPHTRPWPWFNAWCGDIDIIGDKKPQSWYRDVVWGRSPIEILVHEPIPTGKKEEISFWGWPNNLPSWSWDGHEGKIVKVSVISSNPTVRLQLNGKVIGEKSIDVDSSITAEFDVPYVPGTLRATAFRDNKPIATKELKTAGTPTAIRLDADRSVIRADRKDLAFVTVSIVDSGGQVIPTANIPIEFSLSGEGEIIAAGNANPCEMSRFQKPGCSTFRGRALVVVRPRSVAGDIKLVAEAPGLKSGNVVINVTK